MAAPNREVPMPAPIALTPLAWTALRFGAMAAVALYASRAAGARESRADHAQVLDDLPEGLAAHPQRSEEEKAVHGHGRLRRTFRLRPNGPGLEVDAAGLGRVRFRRV